MSYVSVTSSSDSNTQSNSSLHIDEDISLLLPPSHSDPQTKQSRRAYFNTPESRQDVTFNPSHYIQTDFTHGFLSFADNGLEVGFPMVSFDLMKYWDGRPVWFACCERDKKGGDGPGEMIWCVGFEIIESD